MPFDTLRIAISQVSTRRRSVVSSIGADFFCFGSGPAATGRVALGVVRGEHPPSPDARDARAIRLPHAPFQAAHADVQDSRICLKGYHRAHRHCSFHCQWQTDWRREKAAPRHGSRVRLQSPGPPHVRLRQHGGLARQPKAIHYTQIDTPRRDKSQEKSVLFLDFAL